MPEMQPEEFKRLVKEAIKERFDEILIAFGRWSIFSFAAAFAAATIYFVLWANGWRH